MPVTLEEVARRAKVAIGTVSRVVSNSPRVRKATRQRVLNALRELGYRQDRIARALAHEGRNPTSLVARRSRRISLAEARRLALTAMSQADQRRAALADREAGLLAVWEEQA